MYFDIPKKLESIISGCEIIKNNKGLSESEVYLVKNVLGYGDCYLKISPDSHISYLKSEKIKLEWLKNKIPVPRIYYYGIENGVQFLLVSKISGEDALSKNIRRKPMELIKSTAEGLKKIHSIDISKCPFNERIDNKLKLIKNIHIDNIVSNNSLRRGREKNILDLYDYLLENKPLEEDLVFTHGDYCFPNIMIEDDNISGFIDVGRAGIADRYVDLSLIIRSIRINYRSSRLVDRFIEEYGLDSIDNEKLKYYTYLDQLIN